MTPDELLDGFALWQEHKPQSGEDWIAVADRCLADETFDVSKSSPLFAGLILRSRDHAALLKWAEEMRRWADDALFGLAHPSPLVDRGEALLAEFDVLRERP